MADYYYGGPVSEEVFAAWIDGSLTAEEEKFFMDECRHDAGLQCLLDACDTVDDAFEDIVDVGYELPNDLYGDFSLPDIPQPEDGVGGNFGFDDDGDGNNCHADDMEAYDTDDDASADDMGCDTADDECEDGMADSFFI